MAHASFPESNWKSQLHPVIVYISSFRACSQYGERQGRQIKRRVTSLQRGCRYSLGDHAVRSIPTIELFGVTGSQLPGFVDLYCVAVLPDDVRDDSFGLAPVHQKYRTLLRLDIITRRDVQYRYRIVLLRLQLWCFDVNIQRFAPGMVTDQFEGIIRGMLQ